MNRATILNCLKYVKRSVVRAIQYLDLKLIPLFAVNGFLASLYYTFINPAFYREHLGVIRGRLQYRDSLQNINQSSVLLRRNTHRLEKGLIMQPRRAIFAKAYIGETVDCYLSCQASGQVLVGEMRWASDVISEYFEAVADTDPFINQCREKFLNGVNNDIALNRSCNKSKPYFHQALPPTPIDYQSLFTLYKRRRSVRWYQTRSIPDELIDQAVTAASLAPSACNRQPYRFVCFNEKGKAQEIASLAMGTSGFNHQFPCLFVVVGDLSCYPKERDRHVIYIDASLAAMQLMLALETLGLSSCPINWPDIERREKKMASKLSLKSHERVIMLMAAGYADPRGGIAYSQKKEASALLQYGGEELLEAV